jgi:CRISPR-associated protein Cas1
MIKRTLHFGNPCHLKTRNEQLVISYVGIKGMEEEEDKTVPIEDIGVMVLDNQQITISHALMAKLLENNTAVITSNNSHHPTGLLLNLEGNTLQSERFKAQIEASEPLRKQLWQQTVKQKILNQAAVLELYGIETTTMHNLARDVKSGDTDNCEAKAAVYYWGRLFPKAWNFTRHRDGDPPNNLLNYGYAIIRAIMARSLVGSGLLPTLGIFHKNRYNAYCLADDIMEPYRPYVDRTVRNIINETSHIQDLTKELKTRLLQIPVQDVMLNDEKSPLMIATQRSSASLAKCFEGESKKILYPKL